MPDITAPELVEAPLLYQRAIQEKDILTLHVISDFSVFSLNTIGYKFSKKEYLTLHPLVEQDLAEQMQKGFIEQPVPRTTFIDKTKSFLSKILSRQHD